MTLGALMIFPIFLFPIWKITLFAPQYHNGISMYIWINKITGDSVGTLQNINILNHYIGMQKIEPDAIPELKYFQFVLIAMGLIGILVAFLKNKYFYLAWSVVLILLGILGVYDFYLWEYDYGHNLSPTAPIKIPGMVYQPPLLGKKSLLNFVAYSYPHWGTLFLFLASVFGILAFLSKKFKISGFTRVK